MSKFKWNVYVYGCIVSANDARCSGGNFFFCVIVVVVSVHDFASCVRKVLSKSMKTRYRTTKTMPAKIYGILSIFGATKNAKQKQETAHEKTKTGKWQTFLKCTKMNGKGKR